jgi:malate synthase
MSSEALRTPATGSSTQQLRGFTINSAPATFDPRRDLPAGFLDFFLPLHRHFTPRQHELVAGRKRVLSDAHAGKLPNHLPASEATTGKWSITLPDWCQDQRNQMTGPADDAELVVKMLNSGAPGVMLDLEDSTANFWEHIELGVNNIHVALRGELTYFDKKRNKQAAIADSRTVIFTRVRGLHLSQRLPGLGKLRQGADLQRKADLAGPDAAEDDIKDLASASLYDVCRIAFEADPAKLKHPLSFYIPKSESAEEALWWNDLFNEIEKQRGWKHGYIKCMALVESHPLAYQMEEFLYNLRDHILGLNLGRWDYMASLIHFNLSDPEWLLPDRNTIPHDVPFFQNLRDLLVSICHGRGALAIGGMTALYPDRTNPELNARALAVLEKDKKNESDRGFDGAWTGHPDQNQIAVDQFPFPNQIKTHTPQGERYPDLRPKPTRVGKRSLSGTRAAVRIVIRYRNGVLNGKGASLLDGYMEDLATDRIYRLMIAQRVKHRDQVQITDDDGKPVKHTPELITRLFDEELAKLINALPDLDPQIDTFRRARAIAEAMIVHGEVDPV